MPIQTLNPVFNLVCPKLEPPLHSLRTLHHLPALQVPKKSLPAGDLAAHMQPTFKSLLDSGKTHCCSISYSGIISIMHSAKNALPHYSYGWN
jgi:hypothetical protein